MGGCLGAGRFIFPDISLWVYRDTFNEPPLCNSWSEGLLEILQLNNNKGLVNYCLK